MKAVELSGGITNEQYQRIETSGLLVKLCTISAYVPHSRLAADRLDSH